MKKVVKWIGFMALGLTVIKGVKQLVKEKEKQLTRSNMYYDVVLAWLDGVFNDRRIADWLRKNNYTKVAIYGKGTLGLLLYEELKKCNIEIPYFLDQSAKEIPIRIDEIPVIAVSEFERVQTDADVIIVTPVHVFEAIHKDIREAQIDIPIVDLAQIVNEV